MSVGLCFEHITVKTLIFGEIHNHSLLSSCKQIVWFISQIVCEQEVGTEQKGSNIRVHILHPNALAVLALSAYIP
jgi:hypothetical protein